MNDIRYIGQELATFAHALNWKRYYGALVKPYFGERVLEVGAGIGTTTASLYNLRVKEWVCLEPDRGLIARLETKIETGELPPACRARLGTITDLQSDDLYNAILYIDVLEHIQNDRAEAQAAADHLKPEGRLIVISPAHQWLFTPFDRAIGHFRRYSKTSLAKVKPESCEQEKMLYLDAVGLFLSLTNKLLLKQPLPTVEQILFWDRRVVPVSAILDRCLRFSFGKSIVAIWRKISG